MKTFIIKHLLSFALISILLLNLSCKRTLLEPIGDDPPSNKEKYVWTIDTLYYSGISQMLLGNMYGFSNKDIFLVGHNADTYNNVWHWDGEKWSIFNPLPTDSYQNINGIKDIWGISTHEIWAVGSQRFSVYDKYDSASIVFYNGNTWKKEEIPNGYSLSSIWGRNKSDIYAGGWFGSLYHFDGVTWNKIANDTTLDFYSIKGTIDGNVYCIGRRIKANQPANDWMYYLIELNHLGYNIVDSTSENEAKFGISGLWLFNNRIYSYGHGVFLRMNNNWEKIFNNDHIGDINVLSQNKIYAVDLFGHIFFYDGNSWKNPENSPQIPSWVWLVTIWITGEEIFIVGNDDLKTIIYHYKKI